MQVGLGVAAVLCTLALPLAAETSPRLADFIDTARDADIVVLGEIHDNPQHHRNQSTKRSRINTAPTASESSTAPTDIASVLCVSCWMPFHMP